MSHFWTIFEPIFERFAFGNSIWPVSKLSKKAADGRTYGRTNERTDVRTNTHRFLKPLYTIGPDGQKTCGIERSRIFTSKLYSDFFQIRKKKFWIEKKCDLFQKHIEKIFYQKSRNFFSMMFFQIMIFFGRFSPFFRSKKYFFSDLKKNLSTASM